MKLIEILIRRRVLTTVLVLIAVIVGVLSYMQMGLRRFPDIDFPWATIQTVYPGGSPAEIETEITRRIEDAVSSIAGIDEITSYSQQGLSLVMVQFELEEDIDVKAMDVRNQIDLIRAQLPDDAEDPVVSKFSFAQMPVMTLALYGPQGPDELYEVADKRLKTIIAQVSGVAEAEITGGEPREIQVLLEARKLRAHRVPISAVVTALKLANVDVPAGHITQTDREYIVRTEGRLKSVEQILDVKVPRSGRGTLRVRDLGTVSDTYGECRSAARFRARQDGDLNKAHSAVALVVQSESGANEVEVANGVYERMDELRAQLPRGASIEVVEDQSEFVRGALANVRSNMMIGILLTAVVLYLFLRSARATIVVAVVMPASVVATFSFMRFSGFTLNILTLTGLAIVIGVLVNNAILIVDNATRFLEQGLSPVEAATAGTRDIAIAIFSSTATNLVVFLPLAFMGEIIGKFFWELGLTVAYATTVSLLLSYSLTPMMCGLLLRHDGRPMGFLARCGDFTFGNVARLWQRAFLLVKGLYLDLLDASLKHRWTALAVTFAVFAACLGVFGAVGSEFQPAEDDGWIRVTCEMPVGSSLSATDRAVLQMEEQIAHMPHLHKYYVRIGTVSGFLSGSSEGVNLAEIMVYVGDRADREMTRDDLENWLAPRLARVPSARIAIGGGHEGLKPVQVELAGDDLDQLRRCTTQVMKVVSEVPGTTGVAKSYQEGQPEIRVVPRLQEMNRHGVQVEQVGLEVRHYIEGVTASQFLEGAETYDVEVKLNERDISDAGDVAQMYVSCPGTGGGFVQIGQVADLREEAGETLITRKDRRRLIMVTSELTGDRPSGKVTEDIRARLEELDLPEGVHVNFGGEAEIQRENFKELFKAMATAAVLTFLAVAGIIESFGMGLIIIMALPVCLIGVALALLLGDVTVNMFSLMAMVMLVGMVVNNAIIVIDYAARERHSGIPAAVAIRHACETRFRMIIMANLTTVVALIPLSLGLGFAGEIFRPLAVVQMGGILAAAGLSLLVIPVVYAIVRGRADRHLLRQNGSPAPLADGDQ